MPSPKTFTITAPPRTDIWRVPPSTSLLSAPTAHPTRGPLSSFRSARLTLTLPPHLHTYDQAGLLFTLRGPASATQNGSATHNGNGAADAAPQWLKTGLEVFRNEVWVSTVGCDRYADVSIVPLSLFSSPSRYSTEKGARVTVEVEREEGSGAVWVYVVPEEEGRERVPVREVRWMEGAGEVEVAAYAARPGGEEGGKGLCVGCEGLGVEWA